MERYACLAHGQLPVAQDPASQRCPEEAGGPHNIQRACLLPRHPAEAVFGALKSVDYSTRCFPPLEPGAVQMPTRASVKWDSLLRVSRYLLDLSPAKVARLFESRLARLAQFIRLEQV